MRIGEAPPTEVRHRVGLAPDNIIQHPVIEVLKNAPKAENIMIAANDPDRPSGFRTRRASVNQAMENSS